MERKRVVQKNLVSIGEVLKTHGLHGELLFDISPKFVDTVTNAKHLFVNVDNLPLPIEVDRETIRFKSDHTLYVKIKFVSTVEKAKEFVGLTILVDKADATLSDTPVIEERFIGYTIYDQNKKEVGTVIDTDNFAGNFILHVEQKCGEIAMVPLAEEEVIDFRPVDKSITLTIPEGLLDI